KIPRLADDRDHWRLCCYEGLNSQIARRFGSTAAGHSKRADLGVRQFQLASARKIFGILRVARGIAPFDEIDADLIEALGNLQLVLQRQAHAFPLRAVAEGGVVDLDASHVRCPLSVVRRWWSLLVNN